MTDVNENLLAMSQARSLEQARRTLRPDKMASRILHAARMAGKMK